MSIALTIPEADYRPRLRRRRRWTKVGNVLLGIVLLIWTLIPIYNMFLIALSDDGDEFTGVIWPDACERIVQRHGRHHGSDRRLRYRRRPRPHCARHRR